MPLGGGLIAAAPAILQTGAGLLQSVFGGRQAKKAQSEIENLKTPTYQSSAPINDYYNKALQRYGINPYQSQEYQYAMNGANRNFASGLNALQSRRSAVGDVNRLSAINNDAALRAGVTATNQQTQNFNQVGQGAQMKAADDRYGFQINSIMPYQKQLQLLGMKAGAGNTTQNQGFQNIFGGLSNLSMIGNDYYNNHNNNKPYSPPPYSFDSSIVDSSINNIPYNGQQPFTATSPGYSVGNQYGTIGPHR
jgi:hypothetical protein